MSTRRVWKQSEIKTNPLFSKMRSTIETAFYGNNVTLQVAMQKLVALLVMKASTK